MIMFENIRETLWAPPHMGQFKKMFLSAPFERNMLEITMNMVI